MKKAKRLCAWILSFAILLVAIPFVTLPVSAEVDVSTLQLNATFTGATPDPLAYTVGGSGIARNTTTINASSPYMGTIHFTETNGYADFKTAYGSPFVTQVRVNSGTSAQVKLLVSPTGEDGTWTDVTPTPTDGSWTRPDNGQPEGQLYKFTLDTVGSVNRYVRVQFTGTPYVFNYIRSVAFNVAETVMDFAAEGLTNTAGWTANLDYLKAHGLYSYAVKATDAKPFNPAAGNKQLWVYSPGELVFKTAKNSPFHLYLGVYAKNVVFSVSPTGADGSWTTPTTVHSAYVNNTADTGGKLVIPAIGDANQYVKVTAVEGKYLRIDKIAFERVPSHTVSASANDADYGSVSGADTYEDGATVTLTATANSGYQFVRWTENGETVSTEATYTFTAAANRTLVAEFMDPNAPVDVSTLELNIDFNGYTVDPLVYTVGGDGIERNGGTTIAAHDYAGTIYFNKVGGYAVFKTQPGSPFVTQVRTFQSGSSVSLWVSPNGTDWTKATPATATGSWIRPNGSPEGQLNKYWLPTIGAENQYVRVQMDGATSALNYIRSVAFNTSDTVIDFAAEGLTNTAGWTANLDYLKAHGLYSYAVKATDAKPFNPAAGNKQLWVHSTGELVFKTATNAPFALNLGVYAKNVVFSVSPTGADGSWTTPTTVHSAYANSSNPDTGGKHFIPAIGEGNKYVKVTAAEGKYLRIDKIGFVKTPNYTVSASADSAAGSVTGAGTYEDGAAVTLTATANEGYAFAKWTENGETVSTANPYTFNVTANRNLVAVFDLVNAPVDVSTLQLNIDFNGYTVDPLVYTVGGDGIERNGGTTIAAHDYVGTIYFNKVGGYAVFKTQPGSPFVTQVRTFQSGSSVSLWVSPNGTDWTKATPATATGSWIRPNGSPEGQLNKYWLSTIGAENQYVRVQMDGATSALNYIRSVAFNVAQTVIDFAAEGLTNTAAWTANLDYLKAHGLYSYAVKATDAKPFNPAAGNKQLWVHSSGELVFKTVENGAFHLDLGVYAKNVVFSVSPTGADGSWTTPTTVHSAYANSSNPDTGGKLVIPAIGAGNKYVKVTAVEGKYLRINKIAFERLPSVDISASANNTAYGSVSGAGTYDAGDTVTLTATAGADYRFVKWTENGETVSTEATYTFTASAAKTLVAVFEEAPIEGLYAIDFSESKFVGSPNTSVNYTAFDEAGIARYSSTFSYHPGSSSVLAMSNGSYMIFRTELNSIFRAYVWKAGTASVTYEVSPTGAVGTWTEVTPTSIAADSGFDGWQIRNIGENNQYVKMTFNTTSDWVNYCRLRKVAYVPATTPAPITYAVEATSDNNAFGTVTGSEIYDANAQVTVTATPKDGCKFVKWTENGETVSTEVTYTFNVTADRKLVAVFEQLPIEGLYTIDFSEGKFIGSPNTSVNTQALTDAGVLAYSEGFGYHPGSRSLLTMTNGSYLIFRTEPNSIFRANAWKAGSANITFSVSATGLSGSWIDVTPNLTYTNVAGGAGNQNWEIPAIGDGIQFVKMTFNTTSDWTNYGRLFSVSYLPATTPDPDMHTIALSPNKTAYGKVEGTGSYIAGTEVTVTATAYPGYRFVKWTEAGKDDITLNPYTFNAVAPRTLIAVFEVDPEGDIPATDTCLDFYGNNYASSVAQAFMSENVLQPWQAGLCSDVPGANIVYKMQKNSPVVAVYRIFAETTMRPLFYGSKDAKNWEPLTYRTMDTPNPSDEGRMQYYIIDGIGEDNVYLKIQCVDGTNWENFAHFYVDLRELNFNANADPSPYDKTINFVNDTTALASLYAFTPASGVEHTVGRGVHLSLDHLVTKTSAEKVRLIMNVSPNSGFKASFTINEYAMALELLPKLYGSKDGENWTLLPADLFKQGVSNGVYTYMMYMDPQAEEYNFFAFEYQQSKDYTGLEITELDDVVSDCLNTAVMVSSIAYLQAENPVEKPSTDGGNAGGDGYTPDNSYPSDDETNSPLTGDALPKLALVILLAAAVALVLSCKGKYIKLFAKR